MVDAIIFMGEEIKLYRCRGYLFCIYVLCKMSTSQIAKECKVQSYIILNQLRKFGFFIRRGGMKGRHHKESSKTKCRETWRKKRLEQKVSGKI